MKFEALKFEAPCACSTLRRAARAVTTAYDAALAPSGLRITQFSILRKLASLGPLPVTRLAAEAALDRSTMGRNLEPLRAKLHRDGIAIGWPAPRFLGFVRRTNLEKATKAFVGSPDVAFAAIETPRFHGTTRKTEKKGDCRVRRNQNDPLPWQAVAFRPGAVVLSYQKLRTSGPMNQHVSPPGPTVIRNPEDAFVVLPCAQVNAINCMIEIIDEPYTGDDCADYNLRRNKCEAARVLLSLKTRMLREMGWKP